MNVLAIDTSSKYLCLSIAKNDKLVAAMRKPFARELSGKIIPSIDTALKQSKLSLKAIDYFGIGLGPGSFTGLRIGLAVIKGLAFPSNKLIVGVGSLDLLARAVSNHSGLGYSVANHGPLASGLVCPIVDARRSLVYTAIYEIKDGRLVRKSAYLLVSIEGLLKRLKRRDRVVFSGDGLNIYRDKIKNKIGSTTIFADDDLWYPKPEVLMSCVKEKINASTALSIDTERRRSIKNKEFSDLHKLVPIYLYPKECQIRTAI